MNAQGITNTINNISNLNAWKEIGDSNHAGLLAVEHLSPTGRECVGDQIYSLMPQSIKKFLKFVESDESASIVWYKVLEQD